MVTSNLDWRARAEAAIARADEALRDRREYDPDAEDALERWAAGMPEPVAPSPRREVVTRSAPARYATLGAVEALATEIGEAFDRHERAVRERLAEIDEQHRQAQARLLARIAELERMIAGRVVEPIQEGRRAPLQ